MSKDDFFELNQYEPDAADLNDRKILEDEAVHTNLISILTSIQDELDELLELQGLKDDRKIDVSKLDENLLAGVTPYHSDDPNWYNQLEIQNLSNHLLQFFDISDTELDNKQNLKRFQLELRRAAFKIEIQSIEDHIASLHKKSLKLRKDSKDIVFFNTEHEFFRNLKSESQKFAQALEYYDKSKKPEPKIYAKMAPSSPKSKSQKPILIQFEIIQELESKLRELLKNVFSEKQDWWEKYVPFEVRDKLEYRNRKDPNFSGLRKDQSLELIDLLMFREVQNIITGSGFDNYEFFKNIFPNYHYVNERLIEASLLRNPVCHMNELNEKQHKQLLHIKEELVDHINEYLGA